MFFSLKFCLINITRQTIFWLEFYSTFISSPLQVVGTEVLLQVERNVPKVVEAIDTTTHICTVKLLNFLA